MGWVRRPTGLGHAHCGKHEGDHIRQAMTHMLTLHCSAHAAANSGRTSSRGPLARDSVDVTP